MAMVAASSPGASLSALPHQRPDKRRKHAQGQDNANNQKSGVEFMGSRARAA